MLALFKQFNTLLNNFLWGLPMIVFLFGTHLYLTYKTAFIQRYTFKGIKLSLSKAKGKGDISPFAALSTALASTIGTGNIIGVATAIVAGGPGAVFWTWITGIFGIATKYGESYIALKYRKKLKDGSYLGGAMTALEHLGLPHLAIAFALLTLLASFGIGCGVQANAIADLLKGNYQIPSYLSGGVLAVLTAVVIFGGLKTIAKTCTKLVPLMSIFYTCGCLLILVLNADVLWATIKLIITEAFSLKALGGGILGSGMLAAMRYGIARGLFSNESGMGSAPIVSAAAQTANAAKIALINATGVFWDTVVVCLLSGLVIVSSLVKNPALASEELDGAILASKCFAQISYLGTPLLVGGVITFAYSTILGWYCYGERCIKYLKETAGVKLYYLLWVLVAFLGAVANLDLVWQIADNLNALMAIPNLIAVLLLTKTIAADTKYYIHEGHLEAEDPELP